MRTASQCAPCFRRRLHPPYSVSPPAKPLMMSLAAVPRCPSGTSAVRKAVGIATDRTLLLNSDALKGQDADDFRVQLEKVIDVNLEYDPTSFEAVSTAIPHQSLLRTKLVAEYAIKLVITNIRTVFKILRICARLDEVLSGYDERVISQTFRSACLFAFVL
jgi:hypothetical protein